MYHTYRTPQTEDGVITQVSSDSSDGLQVEVSFDVPAEFSAFQAADLHFACRSRIARLGIDIRPLSQVEISDGRATLVASLRAVVPENDISHLLKDVFLPGVLVGRLVLCDPRKRLLSEQLYQAYLNNAFKLPAGFSIDSGGRLLIRPHSVVYDLSHPLTRDGLLAILTQPDGKALLNRLQVPRRVENIVVEPGQGVITSCTMFLHRHFVVLDRNASPLGQHMHAIVLDPIATRGPRVFLEFYNDSSKEIINPAVAGTVFEAELAPELLPSENRSNRRSARRTYSDFESVNQLFKLLELESDQPRSYFDRPIATLSDASAAPPEWIWPDPDPSNQSIGMITSGSRSGLQRSISSFATKDLAALPADAQVTVLARVFPNLYEHIHLISAASEGKVARIIFQKASFEHGPFLSARDHARLIDYEDLGVEVLWCNDLREHVAIHVFRGHRGFFCKLDKVDSFKNALIIAVYGSSITLVTTEADRLTRLIEALYRFFGDQLAILTGGGPGAMQQASLAGKSMKFLVGASYLEIEDQETNQLADFYQVFQENCRHSRQRWFEISGFHIFCIGGVGTLEEIGITLTDIKLGLSEVTPLVFFGRDLLGRLYWESLAKQLVQFVDERRAPEWLRTHVLVTDDPNAVIEFYKRILCIG